MQPLAVWTVGHSNHPLETFAQLLLLHQVQLIADVRSHPYSKFAPHYGCEELPNTLSNLGVHYVFMGVALGGRPTNVEHDDEQATLCTSRCPRSQSSARPSRRSATAPPSSVWRCSVARPIPSTATGVCWSARSSPIRGCCSSHHGGRLRGHREVSDAPPLHKPTDALWSAGAAMEIYTIGFTQTTAEHFFDRRSRLRRRACWTFV